MTAEATLPSGETRNASVGGGNRLHIEAIRVKDLYAFACRFIDSAAGQEISPITKQRALSQSKNPYADGDDVGLFVAYVGGQCVGYQGLLPVRLATAAGWSKAFWCTAMYVRPEYRHRLVAVQLVRRILTLKKDCLINEFADAAGKLCTAIGFRRLPSCPYLDLRFDRLDWISVPFRAVRRLGRRYWFCRRIAELGIRLSDALWLGPLKRWTYARLQRRGRERLRGFTRTDVTRVRPLGDRGAPSGARFVRDVDAVNWTLEWPWIREGAEPTRPPYYFSDVCPLFRNHAVEVCAPDGRYIGFVLLTIMKPYDRTVLKLRDFDLREPAPDDLLLWIVLEYAARYGVDRFELPIVLEKRVRKETPFAWLTLRISERPYLYYPGANDSPLARVGHELSLDISDGDTAFF